MKLLVCPLGVIGTPEKWPPRRWWFFAVTNLPAPICFLPPPLLPMRRSLIHPLATTHRHHRSAVLDPSRRRRSRPLRRPLRLRVAVNAHRHPDLGALEVEASRRRGQWKASVCSSCYFVSSFRARERERQEASRLARFVGPLLLSVFRSASSVFGHARL